MDLDHHPTQKPIKLFEWLIKMYSNENDVVLAISQSGETADTLAALNLAKSKGATVIGICNVVGSSIARATDAGVYTHAGPEVGVASTKAFTTQLAVLTLMALKLGNKKADLAIIEVGLGGRLDSTNIINSFLSIITNISYDHQNILGNTALHVQSEMRNIYYLLNCGANHKIKNNDGLTPYEYHDKRNNQMICTLIERFAASSYIQDYWKRFWFKKTYVPPKLALLPICIY